MGMDFMMISCQTDGNNRRPKNVIFETRKLGELKMSEEIKDCPICGCENISSTQRRMLTQSEIESLQKDKRDSFEKMTAIFEQLKLKRN